MRRCFLFLRQDDNAFAPPKLFDTLADRDTISHAGHPRNDSFRAGSGLSALVATCANPDDLEVAECVSDGISDYLKPESGCDSWPAIGASKRLLALFSCGLEP